VADQLVPGIKTIVGRRPATVKLKEYISTNTIGAACKLRQVEPLGASMTNAIHRGNEDFFPDGGRNHFEE
jgi:hypothetical protein